MPKISVIIPVYNVEKYLPQCLDSITQQTFKDIEIICINDGSLDNSPAILEEYSNKDSRIKIINQQNKGLSEARNTGINEAKGEYISFVDSDDYIEINTYEKIAKYLDSKTELICFGTNIIGDNNIPNLSSQIKYYKIKYSGLKKLNDQILLNTNADVWNKIFKTSIIKDNKLNFPKGVQYESVPFYWQYTSFCTNAYFIKDKLYNYRRRNNSIMEKTFKKEFKGVFDHLSVMEIILNFWVTHNLITKKQKTFEKLFEQYVYLTLAFSKENEHEKAILLAKQILEKEKLKYKSPKIKALLKGDIKKIIDRRTLAQKIFSIKNNKNYKILNILGLKIKFLKLIKIFPKPKVLVHLHLYYFNQVNYIINKLKNINNCDWDLYITICEENQKIIQKILKFKPDTHIIKVKNIGYDIWPFISVLNEVDLNNYDFILKIHTKNTRNLKRTYYGTNYTWRNLLMDALLKNKKIYNSNLYKLIQNPQIGMIASKSTLAPMGNSIKEDSIMYDEFCKRYNIKIPKGNFVAGTMFIARAKCFQIIKTMNIKEKDFVKDQHTNDTGTNAHVIERIFSRIIEYQNFKIETSHNKLYEFKNNIKQNIQKSFSIRNKTIDGIKYKEINIFGIKKYLKRKR